MKKSCKGYTRGCREVDMRKIDVKSAFGREPLDVDHELPAAAETKDEISFSAEPGQVETVEQERDALRARLVRLQADFDNARKRTEREHSEFKSSALADALRSLLPVLDSFDRAMRAPRGEPEGFSLRNRTDPETIGRCSSKTRFDSDCGKGGSVRSPRP
jgi:molecular chaperone GrpE (heat shock protein)